MASPTEEELEGADSPDFKLLYAPYTARDYDCYMCGELGHGFVNCPHFDNPASPYPEKKAAAFENYRRIFDELDADCTGTISIENLAEALKHMGVPTSKHHVIQLHCSMDSGVENASPSRLGQHSAVDFATFASFAARREQRLHQFFEAIDLDRSKCLSRDEVKQGLATHLGIKLSDTELAIMMQRLGGQGSSVVRRDDFVQALLYAPSLRRSGLREFVSVFAKDCEISGIDLGWEGSRDPGPVLDSAPTRIRPQVSTGGSVRQQPQYNDPVVTLLAGALAGCCSRTATAPLDRVKVIVQATGANQGLIEGFKRIYYEGGWRAFWRSNGINVVKVAPETALKFIMYERLAGAIGQFFVNDQGESRLSPAVTKLLSGGIAGVCAQTVIYPLEIFKTRMALMPSGVGLGAVMADILKENGMRGFYRGLLPSTLGIFPYASIDLAVFNTLKETYKARYPEEDPSVKVFLAFGAFSSTCGAVFAYPLQTVRTRLQAQGMQNHFELRAEHYDGMTDCFRKVVRQDGIMGLYRGLLPNLLKVLPAVSISYAVFEKSKVMLLEQKQAGR